MEADCNSSDSLVDCGFNTTSKYSEDNETIILNQCEYYQYIFNDMLWLVIPMTIILLLIFVCGVVENIFVIIFIIANKSMHTTTNFYLFSLAVSDLLYVACYPLVLLSVLWCSRQYPDLCVPCHKLTYLWYAEDLGMDSSSLIVTLFTIERYLAICHPFQAMQLSSQKRRVVLLIYTIWILAICTNLSFYLYKGEYGSSIAYIFILTMYYLTFYIIPFTLITTLCTLMICNIRKTKKMARKDSKVSKDISTERTFKLLGAIVLTFFICWIPTYAFLIVDKFGLHKPVIREYLNLAITVLSCLPAVINPILYSLMSFKFRQTVKVISLRRRTAEMNTQK